MSQSAPRGPIDVPLGHARQRDRARSTLDPWQGDHRRRAPIGPGLEAQRSPMQFDQRIGDGETETRPFHSVYHARARLFEWPTQPDEVFRRDSRAIILDGEMDKLGADSG